jgi:hypothetical protein
MEDALITRLVIANAAAGLLLIFGLGMLVEHPEALPLSGQLTAAGQKDREKQIFVETRAAGGLEPIQWAREPVRDPNAPSWVWRSHYRLSGATMSKEPSTVAGFARN